MQLTTGKLIKILSEYPAETVLNVGCNKCKFEKSGSDYILKVVPRLKQTYGYVELIVNTSKEV